MANVPYLVVQLKVVLRKEAVSLSSLFENYIERGNFFSVIYEWWQRSEERGLFSLCLFA